MDVASRRFRLPGYISLITLLLLICTCGGEIKDGSGVTVISGEDGTGGVWSKSDMDYTRGAMEQRDGLLDYEDRSMESSQIQVLKISHFREIISLDIIQHEKVNLIFAPNYESLDEIHVQLRVPGCETSRGCPALTHDVTHSDFLSHVSLSVHQHDRDYGAGVCVTGVLVLLMAILCVGCWLWLRKKCPSKGASQTECPCSTCYNGHTQIGHVTADLDRIADSAEYKGRDNPGAKHADSNIDPVTRPSIDVTNEASCERCLLVRSSMSDDPPRRRHVIRVLWTGLLIGLGAGLLLGALYVAGGKQYFDQQMGTAVLTVAVPEKANIRHVRSYSTYPDLKGVAMDDSLSLVTRLQLLDLSPDCRDNLARCATHALCEGNNTATRARCRCNRGYYLQDLTCKACTTSCHDGYYMSSQCSAEQDVICKPCRHCEGSTYPVAPCTTTQDTICVDVTFPLKQFEQRTSTQELAVLNMTLSENVFTERLHNLKRLEEGLFMSSNKQEQSFIWRRPSGLEINVKVSGVYLVPVYVDIDHADDMKYLRDAKRKNHPDYIKLDRVISRYCRHPLPDGYDLFLSVLPNVSTAARQITCDSKNFNLPPCPRSHKDGDRYVYKALDWKCQMDSDNTSLFQNKANNILCMDNPEILSKIFQMSVNASKPRTFPSAECQDYATDCRQCLSRRACNRGANTSDCCNKDCYSRLSCRHLYNASCPDTPIRCARGDITKYTMVPRFQSIRQQYACHLRHQPPKSLYTVSYAARVPKLKFALRERRKEVLYRSHRLQEDGVDRADFLNMVHHTVLPVHEEAILVGTFPEPTYTLHELKQSWEFQRDHPFSVIPQSRGYKTSVQFEKPFLYTTQTWQKEGCERNVSRIVPAQSIYKPIGEPLETPIKKEPIRQGDKRVGPFVYQLSASASAPHIRFSIPENTSILSYFKDDTSDAQVNSTSLTGRISWDGSVDLWNITVAGTLTACPGYFSMEIFKALGSARLSVYDVLVKCPPEFSITFSISRDAVRFADVFTARLNDSVFSHRVILTSMQAPQYFSNQDNDDAAMGTKEQSPWILMFVVLSVCVCTSLFLLIVYLYCDGQKSKRIPTDITVPKPDLGTQITLLQNIDTSTNRASMSRETTCIMFTLVALYVAYAFIFTFSALFGILLSMNGSKMGDISFVSNTSAKLESHMHTKLQAMVDYENEETSRMIKSVESRLNACSFHLRSTFYKEVPEINHKLATMLNKMFKQNGTVDRSLRSYYHGRMAVYTNEINEFVDDFNKTLETNLHKLHTAYTTYLEELADNRWFAFPQQLFLDQQAYQGQRLSNVKDNLARFLTWLEVDKVHEIMETKHLLMTRLVTMLPKVNFSAILDDADSVEAIFVNSTAPVNRYAFTSTGGYKKVPVNPLVGDKEYYDANAASGTSSEDNLISNITSIVFPIFIGVFVVLDILLLSYRLSWMCECIRRFKKGVEQRVPYDSITRKIHFILTGKEAARPGDSLDHPYDYYMNNKENIWENNPELYFLYCQANVKSKQEILRDLWSHKREQKPNHPDDETKRCCCIRYGLKFIKLMYRLFISPVFWRLVLICAFVLFLCLVTKATDDLVTMESAMFLIDTDAMLPILARQNLITNEIISQHGDYLSEFLTSYKALMDAELEILNQILVTVADKQSSLLTTMISEVCNLGGVTSCPDVPVYDVVTFTVTSCNFLPLQKQPYTGFHENVISEFLLSELSPLVNNFRSILFSAFHLLLSFAAAMLICQICSRILFVSLWKTKHLRTTKIYQLPSTVDREQHPFREKDMYVSQSLIAESCESGVYDMTA